MLSKKKENSQNGFVMPNLAKLKERLVINKKNNTDETDLEYCKNCNVKMGTYLDEFHMSCPKCNRSISVDVEETSNITKWSSNISTNSSYSFRPTINNSSKNPFSKSMFSNTVPQHNHTQRHKDILNKLKKYNDNNKKFNISLNILKDATMMYIQIQDNYKMKHGENFTRRGDTLDGILGACIIRKCKIEGCPKTKTQIANFMQTSESKISGGILTLKQLSKSGIVNIDFDNNDKKGDSIISYFEDFQINPKFKLFIEDVIQRIYDKNISEISHSNTHTIIIGCIYTLTVVMGNPLTHEIIQNFSEGITKSTYINIYNHISNNMKKLKKPFYRHKIPYPTNWGCENTQKTTQKLHGELNTFTAFFGI